MKKISIGGAREKPSLGVVGLMDQVECEVPKWALSQEEGTGAQSAKTSKRLIPANEWPNHHVWPPIGGLRHLIFYAGSNGFDKVIRRVGRRVLIDEQAFFAWVEAKGVRQ